MSTIKGSRSRVQDHTSYRETLERLYPDKRPTTPAAWYKVPFLVDRFREDSIEWLKDDGYEFPVYEGDFTPLNAPAKLLTNHGSRWLTAQMFRDVLQLPPNSQP